MQHKVVVEPAPNSSTDLGRALAFWQAGQLDEAAAACQVCLAAAPKRADALHLLGVIRYRQGQIPEAVRLLQEAVARGPWDALAWSHLGAALLARGQADAAVAAHQEAARLAPDQASIFYNLGNPLKSMVDLPAATTAYRRALTLAPDHADAWNNLGTVLEPGDLRGAAAAYRQALTLRPGHPLTAANLANVHRLQGQTGAARAVLDEALARAPDPALEFLSALLVPPIIGSRTGILETRATLAEALSRLAAAPPRLDDPLAQVRRTNFFLAYHGLSNRDLHRSIAATFLRACPALGWVAPHCRKPRPARARLRIGFISQFLRDHSIGRTSAGLITRIDRKRFETVALIIPPAADDPTSRTIRGAVDLALDLPAELAAARQLIARLELDILFFQDIGMEPISYYLAFARLAPVQCTSFGHPDTTGIANLDWFISGDLYETPDADGHYSEKLHRLPDAGTLAYYFRPPPPAPGNGRSSFGLPDSGRLYLCPQTLFKLHPDFDDLAAGILRQDRLGRVVLIAQGRPEWVAATRHRFATAAPDVADRLRFIPPVPPDAFTGLLAAADVVLDTPHFNGMNTSLQAFAVGTPVVTWPTALQRGRHTLGMYRRMAIDDGIAADPADYVRRAVALATEPDRRQQVAALIQERSPVLFEDQAVVREFEAFFEQAVAAAG